MHRASLLWIVTSSVLMSGTLPLAPAARAHERHAQEEHASPEEEHGPAAPPGPEVAVARDPAATAAAEPSGHAHRHREKAGFAKLVAWLGNFHPPLVHFPIAMLAGAAVADVLFRATRRDRFAQAGRFCLWFGAVAAVPTALLGWCFAGFAFADDEWVLATHRWLGTLTGLFSVGVLVLRERSTRNARLLPVLVSALLAAATGFFGGALVYGLDHYAW